MIRTMKNLLLLMLVIVGFAAGGAYAADIVQSERDCAEILEQWANDPDSVPRHLVDECKESMAAETAPDIMPFAGGPAADPCAGPGASGSAHCWGPWSSLAPAASGEAPPPDLLPVDEYDLRPELANRYDPVVGSCAPGTPCGFATIVDGISGQGPADDTAIASFDLAGDGSQFTVAAGQAGEIASVGGMTPAYTNRPDGYENMRSGGANGALRSRLIARVSRNGNGDIVTAADAWAHGDAAAGTSNSGFFATGVSLAQNEVNALNTSAVSAVFNGPMSVDNNTAATITVNFGSDPTWSGGWTNPGYAFNAGGSLIGVDLVSDPGQFSGNVVGSDNFVQGALLGPNDTKSIAHVIDVEIDGIGRIRDVGLLRE